ncbi:PepSY domain-containing protein [Aquamicrobium segne]|uniref:PepSY domain-containing protein n=1 Tax=Aquamicrobium segne TaxID=469547 RepID=A0ABW0GZI8_9HYPH
MTKPIWIVALLLVMAGSGTALADDDCHIPMSQWQPREAVQKMAETRGWQVSRIKIDDGCYQVRGLDETGQAFKAKIDPETLSVVKMKRKERHEGDDGPRERRQSSGPGTGGPSGTLPANKLFETGKPPKSVVK